MTGGSAPSRDLSPLHPLEPSLSGVSLVVYFIDTGSVAMETGCLYTVVTSSLFHSLSRGQKIQTSVERMFRIWKERRLYDNAFLKELNQLIEPSQKPEVAGPVSEFKVCACLCLCVCVCV